MPNDYFQFKNFIVWQNKTAMKVCTDSCILGSWVNAKTEKRILDIGTGTGLLALMLAQRYPVPVDAVEINEAAAKQASENVRNSPWPDRITVFHDRIQAFQNTTPYQYDLIISNPPFYANHLTTRHVARNQAIHNRDLPLDALMQSTKKLLSKHGNFYVLLPEKEGRDFEKLAGQYQLFINEKLLIRDKQESNVLRVILKIQQMKVELLEHSLCIKNPNGDYSHEFQRLLQPYYLSL